MKLSKIKVSDFHHICMTYPIVTLCTVLWMYLPYRLPGCIVSMSCVIIIFLKHCVCLWHRFHGVDGFYQVYGVLWNPSIFKKERLTLQISVALYWTCCTVLIFPPWIFKFIASFGSQRVNWKKGRKKMPW